VDFDGRADDVVGELVDMHSGSLLLTAESQREDLPNGRDTYSAPPHSEIWRQKDTYQIGISNIL
jgi:hypothetical protein